MTDKMLEQLRRRIPEENVSSGLLMDLLEDAEAWICAYTRRQNMPDELSGIAVRLAAINYNRLGLEGESSHSEGAVSRSIDAVPADIRGALAPYRLARTVH